MQWPSKIVELFDHALELQPEEGWTSNQIFKTLLDETARRAVWRTRGDRSLISAALRSPYTPLGDVIGGRIEGLCQRLTLHGDRWKPAVDALYEYIEKNVDLIFEVFGEDHSPYDDSLDDAEDSESDVDPEYDPDS
jgi:hypothetical protein